MAASPRNTPSQLLVREVYNDRSARRIHCVGFRTDISWHRPTAVDARAGRVAPRWRESNWCAMGQDCKVVAVVRPTPCSSTRLPPASLRALATQYRPLATSDLNPGSGDRHHSRLVSDAPLRRVPVGSSGTSCLGSGTGTIRPERHRRKRIRTVLIRIRRVRHQITGGHQLVRHYGHRSGLPAVPAGNGCRGSSLRPTAHPPRSSTPRRARCFRITNRTRSPDLRLARAIALRRSR